MAAPKIRVDVWQPTLQPVDTDGVLQTIVQPSKWVTVETYENLATNQRRKNAVSGVEINDSLFAPRTASMTIANRCQSFTAADNDTYTYVYNDSDGVAAHSSTIRLKKRWGVLTHFFHEFQHIRLVDLETHLVLFTGRITSYKLKYEGSRGSIIQIKCRDVLEELNSILCKNLGASFKFTTSHRRSDIIQAMLNVGLNELASLPAGGREKFQTSPVVSTLAGTTYNLISDDNAANDSQIPYSRFERSKEVLEHPIAWEPQSSGSRKLLGEIARVAVSEPHNDETADDQFGYDFYVDSNIGIENLSASQVPPPAMFNYFKRGNRLSSAGSNSHRSDPAYFGLTIKMPVSNSPVAVGHKIPGSGAVYATKLMHRDFDFDNPKDEIFTETILTYEAREDTTETQTGQVATRRVIRDKKFELIYINQLTGQFTYAGKNIDDEWKDSASVGNANSAETLDAYNIAGAKQADDVCRIQGQADTGASPSSSYKAILISDIASNFPLTNYGSDAYVVLKGSRSNSTCRFNAEATQYTEGRPAQVWKLHKAFNFTQMTIVHPDELRKEVFARLLQAQEQVRRGTYTISKAPYYWVDGKIQSITALSPKGQRITFKHDSGSTAQILSNYGIRAGMLVHKRTSDYTGIYQTNTNKDVYGYIFNMYDDSNIDVDLTESEDFAVDDKIRIIIPLRAGDIIQTNNVLADVDGDHLITELTYTEWPNPMTQIESIGTNEARFGAIKKATIWTPHTKEADIEENRPGINNTMRGNQTISSDIVFSQPAANRINWTSGNVITADGTTYQVVSGSTNDATYGLNGAMTGTNKYVLYLKPTTENPTTNAFHIYTTINTSYKQNVDHIKVGTGWVATNGTKANFKTSSNVDDDGTLGAGAEANTTIHDGTIGGDLIVEGAITAAKIAANTITTNQINFTAAAIGGNTDSTASIRAVAAATSGTIAGLAVSASTFYMGTGNFNDDDTPFFIRGVNGSDGNSHAGTAGDFSLGNKLVWDDSASLLTIKGTIEATTITGATAGNVNLSSTGLEVIGTAENNLSWRLAVGGDVYGFAALVPTTNDLILQANRNNNLRLRSLNSAIILESHVQILSGKNLALQEAGGVEFITISAPAISGGFTLTLPTTYGNGNSSQFLQTNGTGTLSWANATDTNTTYSAGTGLTLSGTQFSVTGSTYMAYGDTSHGTHGGGTMSFFYFRGDDASSGLIENNQTFLITGATDKGIFTNRVGSTDELEIGHLVTPSNVGNFASANITVDANGHVTAAANGSSGDHNVNNVGVHTGSISGTGLNLNSGADTGGTYYIRGINVGDEANISLNSSLYLRRSSSSLIWKENPRPIEVDTSKILTLAPRTFTWKDIEGVGEEIRGKTDFGLIAEEVNEILPELVTRDEDGNPSGVRYQFISVLLLEEMKKLKSRIEVLEGDG